MKCVCQRYGKLFIIVQGKSRDKDHEFFSKNPFTWNKLEKHKEKNLCVYTLLYQGMDKKMCKVIKKKKKKERKKEKGRKKKRKATLGKFYFLIMTLFISIKLFLYFILHLKV